ncbi:MAG: precorrin-6Y C5,15-methyltransferase (decarboxylating) subunit CbiT, partial [Pseudomonadota bacterium]
PDGLPPASQRAISEAEIVMGPPRHLDLIGNRGGDKIAWPVPFADGIDILKGLSGRRVAVLASGDPFWYGAGSTIARHFDRWEWVCLPGSSVFSQVAAHMGWPLERVICLGLHAAPLERLRPYMFNEAQIIVTLRDGNAVAQLARYLKHIGAGGSTFNVFESIGGNNQRFSKIALAEALKGGFKHPVSVAMQISGCFTALPKCSGLPDDVFETDGVMTKRPIRAVTLSALAPKPGETLWDIGGGSGSIAIEWLLAHPTCQAVTIEHRTDRLALITKNAHNLGVDRLKIIHGTAPDALQGLVRPDAIFIGGGLSAAMIEALNPLAKGTRAVANAVTLEAENLLVSLHREKGGDLMRFDIARAKPMGAKRGWNAAYPIVQWAGVL